MLGSRGCSRLYIDCIVPHSISTASAEDPKQADEPSAALPHGPARTSSSRHTPHADDMRGKLVGSSRYRDTQLHLPEEPCPSGKLRDSRSPMPASGTAGDAARRYELSFNVYVPDQNSEPPNEGAMEMLSTFALR